MANAIMFYITDGLLALGLLFAILSLSLPWYGSSGVEFYFLKACTTGAFKFCIKYEHFGGWAALFTTIFVLVGAVLGLGFFALCTFNRSMAERLSNGAKHICKRQPFSCALLALASVICWCAGFPYNDSSVVPSSVSPHAALIFAILNTLAMGAATFTSHKALQGGDELTA